MHTAHENKIIEYFSDQDSELIFTLFDRNRLANPNGVKNNKTSIGGAFVWSRTREGQGFWSLLDAFVEGEDNDDLYRKVKGELDHIRKTSYEYDDKYVI